MPRVKRGNVRRAKRKKLLARAKGFYQTKSKLYRAAKEAVDTAGKYAFVGRKNKKREYRRLWVVRINAAARENGLTYSQMMRGLKVAGITLDRKMLADMAVQQSAAFAKVAAQAKAALPAEARAWNSGTIDRSAFEAVQRRGRTFRARLAAADADQALKALHDEFLSRKSGSVTALMKTARRAAGRRRRREFGQQAL